MTFAQTPEPPYYAVIFTSQRTDGGNGYAATAERMVELAQRQPGFLGAESVRAGGFGITVSYRAGEADITAWKRHAEHRIAQETDKSTWYADYAVRVCKIERDYGTAFRRPQPHPENQNLENP